MENEYEIIANLNNETKKIYEKHYNSENYDILLNENDMILAKKNNNIDINLKHEKLISEVLVSMIKKYKGHGLIYINLTKEYNLILKRIKDIPNIKTTNNAITWPLRQAILKALINKNDQL